MSTLILGLWSLICSLLTLNVFKPFIFKKHGWVTFTNFLLGLVVGDLALHWILLNSFFLFCFSLAGACDSAFGTFAFWVILANLGILWLRFLFLFRLPQQISQQIQWQQPKLFEKALGVPQAAPWNWKFYWNPWAPLSEPNISITRDIVYHTEGRHRLKLDIYKPTGQISQAPVLLQIHGGGWILGTKRQAMPLMTHMASKGWVCVSIEYRLSPQVQFPEHLIDCKRATHWIQKHIQSHGGNPDFIVVTGGSAGGHLASLMALTSKDKSLQPSFEEAELYFRGCVSFYGVYDCEKPFGIEHAYPAFAKLLKQVIGTTPTQAPEKYQKASPIQQITSDAPPFMLVHGETDALVSSQESCDFYYALKNKTQHTPLYLSLPLLEHAFDEIPSIPTQALLPSVESFLEYLHAQYTLPNEEPLEAG